MCIRDRCGVYIQKQRNYSGMSESVLKTLTFATIISFSLNISLLFYMFIFQWGSIIDPGFSAISLTMYSYNLFLTIYFYFARHKFDEVLNRFDNALILFYSSPLCEQTTFFESLRELVNKLNKFCIYFVTFTCSLGILSITIRYIRYKLGFSEDSIPIYQFPFEAASFPLYDITFFYQLVTMLFCTVIRGAMDSLFAVFFICLLYTSRCV